MGFLNTKLTATKLVLMCAVFMFVSFNAFAVDYPLGSEGIKAASFPGPGFYYVMYNQYYTSDTNRDKDGDKKDIGFDVDSYAMAHRFVYVTDRKILGADYGMNVIVPVVNANLKIDAAKVDESSFGVGDITVEPIVMAWHRPQQDVTISLSFLLPTGEYDENDALSVGGDHYNITATAGTTLFTPDRLWSLSVLARYEKHSENRSQDLTYGDDFFFEWGAGRSIGLFDVGLSGYAHWQVTEDSGSAKTSDDLDRVYAAGPEIQVAIPQIKGQLRFKYLKEFDAEDTKEGDAVWVTLVKAF
ncbi:MAG: transporter [Deferribacterales bacterium]